jgi:regulatory protein
MADSGGDPPVDGAEVPATRRRARPLDARRLDDLAVAYVGRFATTRAKLRRYLDRKLAERGWDGAAPPNVDALVDRVAGYGYVDDAAFAEAKARALTRRGYGARRVAQAVRAAGVEAGDAADALDMAADGRVEAALAYARRRRWGPFAPPQDDGGDAAEATADPARLEKCIAAFLRAGHDARLARAILTLPPGGDTSGLE